MSLNNGLHDLMLRHPGKSQHRLVITVLHRPAMLRPVLRHPGTSQHRLVITVLHRLVMLRSVLRHPGTSQHRLVITVLHCTSSSNAEVHATSSRDKSTPSSHNASTSSSNGEAHAASRDPSHSMNDDDGFRIPGYAHTAPDHSANSSNQGDPGGVPVSNPNGDLCICKGCKADTMSI